jgi:hypothetical protein
MVYILPVGNTKFSTFDPGDSIIKSVDRVAAFFETASRLQAATIDYNSENEIVPVPPATLTWNDEDNTVTFSATSTYERTPTGDSARNYIGNSTGWVIPTTGEMAGIDSLEDAFKYQVNEMLQVCDILRPNVLLNSPKGLVTFDDNRTQSNWLTAFTLPYNTVLSATGVIEKRAANFCLYLDDQLGLV